MVMHSDTNNFFPKVLQEGGRHNLRGERRLVFPGGVLLWSAVAKVLLAVVPLTFAVNFWLASAIDEVESKIKVERQAYFQVKSKNQTIQAERQQLTSPEYMQNLAAQKLALMAPKPAQIQRM